MKCDKCKEEINRGMTGILRKDGFSSQDIAHIGLRLPHLENFMWIVKGTEHMKSKEVK